MSDKKLPPTIVYLAAPVTAPTWKERQHNIYRMEGWFYWFIEDPLYENISFLCPWYPYVEILSEGKHRARGLRDDLIMVPCAQEIWGCALKFDDPLTEGMDLEFERAALHNMQRRIYRTIDGERPRSGEHLRIEYGLKGLAAPVPPDEAA